MFHHHTRFQHRLCDVIDAIPAHHVTIVRDPYDVFVSMYFWEQERSSRGLGRDRPRPRHAMYGKPLDHEDVLEFLADRFGQQIAKANGWLHGGRAIPIRYEELHADPIGALKRLTDQIEPVPVDRIDVRDRGVPGGSGPPAGRKDGLACQGGESRRLSANG